MSVSYILRINMEILFGLLLIVILAIVLYISQSPHCPKHPFVPMQKRDEIRKDKFTLNDKSEAKHYEVTYQCPKCCERVIVNIVK